MNEDAQSLTQRLETLIQFIEGVNIDVRSGKIPALGDLDQKVAQLCLDVEKSPPVIAKQMQPLMAKMITQLDDLAKSLQALKNKDGAS